MFRFIAFAVASLFAAVANGHSESNQKPFSYNNPIIPGFHPDPSCVFVSEWNQTYFCAHSTINAFPGIPITASKDLRNWKLTGHAISRIDQVPGLAQTNLSSSGLWAPTIRYHDGFLYVASTLVKDSLPKPDNSRWSNFYVKTEKPYDLDSWSDPVWFDFAGYDTELFWNSNGQVFVGGCLYWRIQHALQFAEFDLETGETGEFATLWEGTGGIAPEAQHLYIKDGGTGLEHMVTVARSESLWGPYDPDPENPVLSAYNTTSYFQTVGHADLFQDASDNWWAVALSTRSGPEWKYRPMGRETVLTPVTWLESEFPTFENISGLMQGWDMPQENLDVGGAGPFIGSADDIAFNPGSTMPIHFTYYRPPVEGAYIVSPPCHPNALQISPSKQNLTGIDGESAGDGQTFVGRRQESTLFTYSVNIDFKPSIEGEEAGVSIFLAQNAHLELGIVYLPSNETTQSIPGHNTTETDPSLLIPQIRFSGEGLIDAPETIVAPLPGVWEDQSLHFGIKAVNWTHYAFSVGPPNAMHLMQTIAYGASSAVSGGYTGALLGVYCTANGGQGKSPAYVSDWKYEPQGQIRS